MTKREAELRSQVDQLTINGYKLPKSMANLIKSGAWKKPRNKKKLSELVIRKCPFANEIKGLKKLIPDFTLYSLGVMQNESEYLDDWHHPKWENDGVMFLGRKDENIYPGNIETDKVILFADFGLGSDMPFGLDYRENPENPTVILLYWGDKPIEDNRWKKIANSFDEFKSVIWG